MDKIRNGLRLNSWEEFNHLKDEYLSIHKTCSLTFADSHFYTQGPNVERYRGIYSYRSIKCSRYGKPTSAKSKKTQCSFHIRGNHDPNNNDIEIKSHNLKHNHPLEGKEDEVLVTYPPSHYLQVFVEAQEDALPNVPGNVDGKNEGLKETEEVQPELPEQKREESLEKTDDENSASKSTIEAQAAGSIHDDHSATEETGVIQRKIPEQEREESPGNTDDGESMQTDHRKKSEKWSSSSTTLTELQNEHEKADGKNKTPEEETKAEENKSTDEEIDEVANEVNGGNKGGNREKEEESVAAFSQDSASKQPAKKRGRPKNKSEERQNKDEEKPSAKRAKGSRSASTSAKRRSARTGTVPPKRYSS